MSAHQALLCRYHYDPLDRLAGHIMSGDADIRLFYQKTRLATQIQGTLHRSILQLDDQLLAQQQSSGKAVETTLLATDQQRSVLQSMGGSQREASAYTAYGHLPMSSGLSCLLGFDGERRDPVTGHYLLGNGYRAFNPVLMRFNCPDSLSPFGEGGLNAYAYCQGDPVNYQDTTGHIKTPNLLKALEKVQPPSSIQSMGRQSVSHSTVMTPAAFTARGGASGHAAPSSAVPSFSAREEFLNKSPERIKDLKDLTPKEVINVDRTTRLTFYKGADLQWVPGAQYKEHMDMNLIALHTYNAKSQHAGNAGVDRLVVNLSYARYVLRRTEGGHGTMLKPLAVIEKRSRLKKKIATLVRQIDELKNGVG